jgi:hypothetical protein
MKLCHTLHHRLLFRGRKNLVTWCRLTFATTASLQSSVSHVIVSTCLCPENDRQTVGMNNAVSLSISRRPVGANLDRLS